MCVKVRLVLARRTINEFSLHRVSLDLLQLCLFIFQGDVRRAPLALTFLPVPFSVLVAFLCRVMSVFD